MSSFNGTTGAIIIFLGKDERANMTIMRSSKSFVDIGASGLKNAWQINDTLFSSRELSHNGLDNTP